MARRVQTKRVSTFGKLHPCPANTLCNRTSSTRLILIEAMPLYASADQEEEGMSRDMLSRSEAMTKFLGTTEADFTIVSAQRMRQESLNYPASGQEPQKADGLFDNRRLNHSAESINMNVRGCPETDVPSSREEKPGQRRRSHTSRGTGKPSTGRRGPEAHQLRRH